MSAIRKAIFFALLFLVTYLSLKPGSSVQEEIWLPSHWGLWLDIHDNWKNALGFGALAFSAFAAWPQGWGPLSLTKTRTRRAIIALSILLLIATFEGLQIFLPGRHPDPADLTAGALGTAFAWMAISQFVPKPGK